MASYKLNKIDSYIYINAQITKICSLFLKKSIVFQIAIKTVERSVFLKSVCPRIKM